MFSLKIENIWRTFKPPKVVEIPALHPPKRGIVANNIDLDQRAKNSERFSGSELEQAIA
jgi:hypothetical protein